MKTKTKLVFDQDYRIPIVDLEKTKGPHNTMPIDTEDPRFAEPLVNLDDYGIAFESYHAKTDGKNPPYFRAIEGGRQEGWLRKSFVEKLVAVNELLLPYGAELFVLDAYRPMDCQRGLWKFFYERGQKELPDGNDEDHTNYALQYLRDPRNFDRSDSRTFPIHTTGSSVDCTLRDLETGEFFDMGSEFEEMTPDSVTDYFERELDSGAIDESDVRLRNRRLMHWALGSEEIWNDPRLFWHSDWGNTLYVKVRRALSEDPPAAAWYDFIDPPEWGVPAVGLPDES